MGFPVLLDIIIRWVNYSLEKPSGEAIVILIR